MDKVQYTMRDPEILSSLILKGLFVFLALLVTACNESSVPGGVSPQLKQAVTMTPKPSDVDSMSNLGAQPGEQAIEDALKDVIITGQSDGAPSGCSPREIAHLIVQFFNEFNRGDQKELARFFNPTFQWYYVGQDGFETSNRDKLLAYFAERHQHREQLRLIKIQVNGWDEPRGLVHFGPLFFSRHADDINRANNPEGITDGKGAIICEEKKILVWATGSGY